MVSFDLLLFVVPILLVLHTKVLELFQENKIVMLVVSACMPVAHFVLVGLRWQIGLLYVLHGLLALVAAILLSKEADYRLGHGGVRRICSFAVIASILFSVIFPVGLLMNPTGPYKIGTASMTYTSTERRELYGKTYDSPRVFVIQFYYPADRVGTRRAPLIEHGDAVEKGMSKAFGVPRFLLGYLSQLPSNSWYDTGVSENEKQYPVVVLSHGWKGFKNIHSNLAENLASNGYIVISIDHTYGSLATTLDSGQVLELNPAALPNRSESDQYLKYAAALVETFRGDILETLDLIHEMNTQGYNSILTGRMNLDKIAVVGHSTGGGAGVRASIADERIKAIIGLDAWVEPMVPGEVLSGLKVPYLHITSEAWQGGLNEANLNMLLSSSKDDRWLISIAGTKHTDFTMMGFMSPVSEFVGISGPNIKEAAVVQDELVMTFLSYYMDGKNTKTAIDDIVKRYESATAEAVYMK